MPSGVSSINYSTNQVIFFNQRVVSTFFMRLIASMLGCFFILSVYLWLSLLIVFQSSLTVHYDRDIKCNDSQVPVLQSL